MADGTPVNRTFGDDVVFLRQYVDTVVLEGESGAAVAVVPDYQGRVMTSTANGVAGNSYGWINEGRIASGQPDPQINLYGGEDRFWLGPEGGQYSIFFDPQSPFEFANWRVPALIDTDSYAVTGQDDRSISFQHSAKLVNYAEFEFDLQIDRRIDLLTRREMEEALHLSLPEGLPAVAFASNNRLTNSGQQAWKPETGLLGMWVLGLSNPSPGTTVIIPFRRGSTSELGPIVNGDYFGELDESRLKVDDEHGLIFFLGDGRYRSKIGVGYLRATSLMGAWDQRTNTLTVVQFNLPEQTPAGYVNNVWSIQDQPFAGDVVNSYNDGPNETGDCLGPFFELETLSPALALSPGESYTHIHRTFHFEGDQSAVEPLCQQLFGVPLNQVALQF